VQLKNPVVTALGAVVLAMCLFIEKAPAAETFKQRHPDSTFYTGLVGAALTTLGITVGKREDE
jgi:hypothetical protein